MTSTELLSELGTYTRLRKSLTSALTCPGRSAAYTSLGSSSGGIPGSVEPGDESQARTPGHGNDRQDPPRVPGKDVRGRQQVDEGGATGGDSGIEITETGGDHDGDDGGDHSTDGQNRRVRRVGAEECALDP